MAHPLHPCSADWRLIGDPVDIVTGANTDVSVDFQLPGPLPLRWRRYYNSTRCAVACSLGWGHAHELERTLNRDLDGLHYTDPLGQIVEFPPLDVEGEAIQDGFLLRRLSEVVYELEPSGEPVMEFVFAGPGMVGRLRRLSLDEDQIVLAYTSEGLLREIVDSRGVVISARVDRGGRLLELSRTKPGDARRQPLMEYEYDLAGNLVVARDLFGFTQGFRWDGKNRQTCRTDRRGYSFHFAYDPEGRCVHSRGDDGLFEVSLDYQPQMKATFVRRGDGGQWTHFYNDVGTVTQVIDPYGGVTRFNTDAEGRVVEEVDPNRNVTQLLYDPLGKHDARIDPLGHLLPTRAEDPDPPDPLGYLLPETPLEWEHGGLVQREEIRRLAVDSPLLQGVPAAVFNAFLKDDDAETESSPVEDELGRPVEQGPRGNGETWKYDPNGNLIEQRDRDGSVFRFGYGSWNALRQEIDPCGHVTSYQQSPQGQVISVTDPGGTVTEYEHDLKNRVTEVRRLGRVYETYRYDLADNLVAKLDGEGHTLVSWEVGPGNLDLVRRLASGETHQFEHDDSGRMVAAVTPTCVVTFSHDEDGRQLSDQRDGLGVVHEFHFGYLSTTTYLGKYVVEYGEDEDGDTVITDPTGKRHRIRWDSGLVVREFANGTLELALYDEEGRSRRKAVVSGNQRSHAWIRSYTYTPAGDLCGASDSVLGLTRYRHDAAHRLIEETQPDGKPRSYGHDKAGNLLWQPSLSLVDLDTGNRLRSANQDRFTYNDREHLIGRAGVSGATRYEYNELGMLVRCMLNEEVWTAGYDALCRRTHKTWLGRTTTYYWDDFRLAAEVRHDGSLRVYVYADEIALVPMLFVEYPDREAASDQGAVYLIFTNQIGTPIRVEDVQGVVCWSARIAPYGLAQVSPDSTIEMPLRFPGHYHDPETGLHYNRFRYYSPELGRYLQSDPLGLAGGLNLYAYPEDPLTGADIDGLNRSRSRAPASRKGPKSGGKAGAGSGCPPAKTPRAKPARRKPAPLKKSANRKPPKKARKPSKPDEKKWKKKGGKVLKDHPTKGSTTYVARNGVSVTYNKKGYPDFKPHAKAPASHPDAKAVVTIQQKGNRTTDFADANKAAGMPEFGQKSPPGHTWHHHEDGKTMVLVPRKIHSKFPHSGGVSKLKQQ